MSFSNNLILEGTDVAVGSCGRQLVDNFGYRIPPLMKDGMLMPILFYGLWIGDDLDGFGFKAHRCFSRSLLELDI